MFVKKTGNKRGKGSGGMDDKKKGIKYVSRKEGKEEKYVKTK